MLSKPISVSSTTATTATTTAATDATYASNTVAKNPNSYYMHNPYSFDAYFVEKRPDVEAAPVNPATEESDDNDSEDAAEMEALLQATCEGPRVRKRGCRGGRRVQAHRAAAALRRDSHRRSHATPPRRFSSEDNDWTDTAHLRLGHHTATAPATRHTPKPHVWLPVESKTENPTRSYEESCTSAPMWHAPTVCSSNNSIALHPCASPAYCMDE